MKHLYPLIGLLLLFAACEKDIEFNGAITEPLMVVNAITTPDSLFEIKVTESLFFLASADTFTTVKDASVALFLNGVFRENMTHLGNGRYQSTYKVTVGDAIRLVVEAPGLESTSAEMVIVQPVEIESMDTTLTLDYFYPILNYIYTEGSSVHENDTIGWSYGGTINVTLTFTDPPNESNFYRLVIQRRQFSGLNNEGYVDYVSYDKTDIVFGENNNSTSDIFEMGNYNEYGTFTDELINGKHYPLKFEIYAYWDVYNDNNPDSVKNSTSSNTTYTIDLQTLSKSYYLYLITSSNYSADNLFAEPVQIHTNINGGTGILGNYASKKRELK